MLESDGEVSQFDSLDNCSESGMSAENFNTLKKIPLAPIDPPPEFQDSPKTSLRRASPNKVVSCLRRWTSSQSSFEHLKENVKIEFLEPTDEVFEKNISRSIETSFVDEEKTAKDFYSGNKHFYSSELILHVHSDNIYEEPNNLMSSSLGNSFDMESDSGNILPNAAHLPPVSALKTNQALCPYFQDHRRYFKAITLDQDQLALRKNISSAFMDNNYCSIGRSGCHQLYKSSNSKHLNSSSFNHTSILTYGNRPLSRNSLSSRLSSSHNSLNVSSTNKVDDSIFITQAMSHDALLTREIIDFYNVPIDSDIYALPVDMIYSEEHYCDNIKTGTTDKIALEKSNAMFSNTKKYQETLHEPLNKNKRRKKVEARFENKVEKLEKKILHSKVDYNTPNISKRVLHNKFTATNEPLHMTLNEVKQLYHSFYSNSKNDSVLQGFRSLEINKMKMSTDTISSESTHSNSDISASEKNSIDFKTDSINNNVIPECGKFRQTTPLQLEHKTNKQNNSSSIGHKQNNQWDKKLNFSLNLKQKFCSIFRIRKNFNRCQSRNSSEVEQNKESNYFQQIDCNTRKFQTRALPPVPHKCDVPNDTCSVEQRRPDSQSFEFTTSIEKVKDYGWYWGPLSCEAAEKVLSNEPDGSFIVRDSSDDHYIFSLSFKLNNCVRHVRIEQDQGTFSFGSYAKFKSQTITEFIEKAVEHSRSGRYLFFLHRRPEHGPMRVQLTNPVSRFKHVQSLQHLCRFIILKTVVRKDLLQALPLPRRLLDYLNYKHCYSEQVENDCSQSSGDGTT